MIEKDLQPFYLSLSTAERKNKIRRLEELVQQCALCPRVCGARRAAGEKGDCQAPAGATVDSYGPHFGEESVLVGSRGSGTIFFTHCNLCCLFCQNWTISQEPPPLRETSPERLAKMMLFLQNRGCHNLNLVTPTPHLPAIFVALDLAIEAGLRLPVVYNTSGYERVEVLRVLERLVDIYMPDAKYGSDQAGRELSGVEDYYTHLRKALPEMQRQVGDLVLDEQGIACRGLLVRHLVLPGGLAGSVELAGFLKEAVSPHCAVNVMNQYRPEYRAGGHAVLNRRPSVAELAAAREIFSRSGLRLVR